MKSKDVVRATAQVLKVQRTCASNDDCESQGMSGALPCALDCHDPGKRSLEQPPQPHAAALQPIV